MLEVMLPYLKEDFGNASSVHAPGRKARHAVEDARERVAASLGAEPSEIIFTSGGTEADNLALRGSVAGAPGSTLITSAAEHEAVLRSAEALAATGVDVRILDPDRYGRVTAGALRSALEGVDRGLVSVMYTNNEVGTVSPIPELVEICHEGGITFHTDAVQAAGHVRLDVKDLGVDLLSLSAHKFNGPKGVGALYVRGGAELVSQITGGSQERRRRGGTENVASIAGMATALELAMAEADAAFLHVSALRDRLVWQLREAVGDRAVFNTPLKPGEASPHVVNVAFPPVDGRPVDGEMLLLGMDLEGVCVSAGSACTSGAIEPSHVLTALGLDRATAAAAIRFSLGKENTEEDIDYAVDALSTVLKRMRVL